ncbi:HNH endonuclease [Porticoccaceae bacterium]|nr:HNH endonuclease [Porticoccaceae bacterium]
MSDLTQARLKEILHYAPDTGIWTWLVPHGSVKVGDVAGCKEPYGYRLIWVGGKKYRAHRLAFLYMTGRIPRQVDHINQNREDDRWSNLRAATPQENQRNVGIQSNNTSGCVGVTLSQNEKKWRAYIKVDGEQIYLGTFTEMSEAVGARKAAEAEYGFHENHGRAL